MVGQLLWSGRQTEILQFTKFIKFDNFNSKACLGCLNGYIVLIQLRTNRYMHGQIYFEGNANLRLFSLS